MARRSVTLNRLEEQITVCQADLSDSLQFFTKESVDNVLVNPPYFPVAATSLKKSKPAFGASTTRDCYQFSHGGGDEQ